MVEKLEFNFGNEYILIKNNSQIKLSWQPQWQDAQVGPPFSKEWQHKYALLNDEEFEMIWKVLSEIDFSAFKNLQESDFVKSPPDMNQIEKLRFVFEGILIVDWQKESAFLKSSLRNPLQVLSNQLKNVFDIATQRQLTRVVEAGPFKPINQIEYLETFYALPDLLKLAKQDVICCIDPYIKQNQLAEIYFAKNISYRLSMPYRHFSECKTGEHQVATVEYTLVNPRLNLIIKLWDLDIHEAEVHDALLPDLVINFLSKLSFL